MPSVILAAAAAAALSCLCTPSTSSFTSSSSSSPFLFASATTAPNQPSNPQQQQPPSSTSLPFSSRLHKLKGATSNGDSSTGKKEGGKEGSPLVTPPLPPLVRGGMTRLTKEERKERTGKEAGDLGAGAGAAAAAAVQPPPAVPTAAAAAAMAVEKEEAKQEGGEWVEPICRDDPSRFVLFPMKHPDLWEMYKRHEASFWTAEEVDLSQDMEDWQVGRE